jgi:hypothetical protein
MTTHLFNNQGSNMVNSIQYERMETKMFHSYTKYYENEQL